LETFLANPPAVLTEIVVVVVVALLAVGAGMSLISLRMSKDKRLKLLVGGIIIMVSGAGIFFISDPSGQNTVAIGNSSLRVSAPPYFNLNLTSGQIGHAYVVNLNDWNISISSRTDGSALGSYDAGFFTLSNGASADVLTTGQSNLVLVLKSGTYVIVGPSNFQAFLSDFDQSVMNVNAT
jgi:hypothetical protein